MWYETKRHTTRIRESTSASHYHVTLRENLPGCGKGFEIIPEFGCSLVAGLPDEWPSRRAKPGKVGPTATPRRSTETAFEETITARRGFCGIYHRFMDLEAYRPADSERIRHSLHECRRLEAVATSFRMELSEAGETGVAKGRKRDREMESKNLAPDKKKPENLGPISRFLMKADSCLFLLSAERGLQPDVHRFCATAIAGIKYRPSDVLLSRPAVKGSGCTFVFTPITSLVMKLSAFFDIFCATFASRWFSFGMEDKFTSERMLRFSWVKRAVSMFFDFRVMLLNLIRLSTYGRMASAICRTVPMKQPTAWVRTCGVRWVGFAVRNVFSDRVSSIRNFHGLEINVSIIS